MSSHKASSSNGSPMEGFEGIMTAEARRNQRNAVLAGFLGWTLDAFDYVPRSVLDLWDDSSNCQPRSWRRCEQCISERDFAGLILPTCRTLTLSTVVIYSPQYILRRSWRAPNLIRPIRVFSSV